MAELGLSDEALEVYEGLESDHSRWSTLDKVDTVLDELEANPGSRENRLRRLHDPGCFAVPVATPEGDWVVLWREVTSDDEFSELAPGDVYVLDVGALPE